MQKKYIVLIFAVVVIMVAGLLGIRFFSGEDNWICENGQWIKHGNPSAPMPTQGCGKNESQTSDAGETESTSIENRNQEIQQNDSNESPQAIGGQKDEHGCLGPAGYSWCPSTEKCQRMWEEYCEEFKENYRGNENVKVTLPAPNSEIKSPLTITGEAKGAWFFEASFPIKIEDQNGNILGQGIAQAKSDWMTEDFVPFEATISFDAKGNTKGYIVLEKDNPSGLSQNDQNVKIPIVF